MVTKIAVMLFIIVEIGLKFGFKTLSQNLLNAEITTLNNVSRTSIRKNIIKNNRIVANISFQVEGVEIKYASNQNGMAYKVAIDIIK